MSCPTPGRACCKPNPKGHEHLDYCGRRHPAAGGAGLCTVTGNGGGVGTQRPERSGGVCRLFPAAAGAEQDGAGGLLKRGLLYDLLGELAGVDSVVLLIPAKRG